MTGNNHIEHIVQLSDTASLIDTTEESLETELSPDARQRIAQDYQDAKSVRLSRLESAKSRFQEVTGRLNIIEAYRSGSTPDYIADMITYHQELFSEIKVLNTELELLDQVMKYIYIADKSMITSTGLAEVNFVSSASNNPVFCKYYMKKWYVINGKKFFDYSTVNVGNASSSSRDIQAARILLQQPIYETLSDAKYAFLIGGIKDTEDKHRRCHPMNADTTVSVFHSSLNDCTPRGRGTTRAVLVHHEVMNSRSDRRLSQARQCKLIQELTVDGVAHRITGVYYLYPKYYNVGILANEEESDEEEERRTSFLNADLAVSYFLGLYANNTDFLRQLKEKDTHKVSTIEELISREVNKIE